MICRILRKFDSRAEEASCARDLNLLDIIRLERRRQLPDTKFANGSTCEENASLSRLDTAISPETALLLVPRRSSRARKFAAG